MQRRPRQWHAARALSASIVVDCYSVHKSVLVVVGGKRTSRPSVSAGGARIKTQRTFFVVLWGKSLSRANTRFAICSLFDMSCLTSCLVSCVWFMPSTCLVCAVDSSRVLCVLFGVRQTQLEVKKWREAEVMDVRHGEAGTEVWVSGLGGVCAMVPRNQSAQHRVHAVPHTACLWRKGQTDGPKTNLPHHTAVGLHYRGEQ